MSTAELAVSYAALILADDGVDVTVRFLLPEDPAHLAHVMAYIMGKLLTIYRPTSSKP